MAENKAERILGELHEEIAAGRLGRRGDVFMTVRELCEYKGISLKTSFKILTRLRSENILEKSGRNHRLASLLPDPGEQDAPLLVGFLATSLESPYFAQLATHAEEIVHSAGGAMIIASSNYDFAAERERLRMFRRQHVAGALVCPWANGPEEERFYETLDIPYVLLGRRLEHVRSDAVLVDNGKASREVAAHLLSLGIRDFAYVGLAGKHVDERLRGFRSGLLDGGASLPEGNVLRLGYGDEAACRAGIAGLLRRRPRSSPLGVFCYHDLFAFRVLSICHELGVGVPEEVAIAGFDDLPAAEEMYPPLTSVSYPIRDMAQLAFESLYARIRFKTISSGMCRYLDPRLVIRASTRIPSPSPARPPSPPALPKPMIPRPGDLE